MRRTSGPPGNRLQALLNLLSKPNIEKGICPSMEVSNQGSLCQRARSLTTLETWESASGGLGVWGTWRWPAGTVPPAPAPPGRAAEQALACYPSTQSRGGLSPCRSETKPPSQYARLSNPRGDQHGRIFTCIFFTGAPGNCLQAVSRLLQQLPGGLPRQAGQHTGSRHLAGSFARAPPHSPGQARLQAPGMPG